jgi:hypothetical protein
VVSRGGHVGRSRSLGLSGTISRKPGCEVVIHGCEAQRYWQCWDPGSKPEETKNELRLKAASEKEQGSGYALIPTLPTTPSPSIILQRLMSNEGR